MKVIIRCFVLAAVVSAVGMPLRSDAAVREYFGEDSFELPAGGTVVVNVWDIDVFVRAADAPLVQCTTDLKISGLGAEKADAWIAARVPKFAQEGNTLRLDLDPGDEGFLGFGSLTRRRRMGLLIPHSVVPDITTSSGKISVTGDFFNAKPLRLRTGDGDIEVSGGADEIEIHTTSGNSTIRVFTPLNRFWARTSSGSITLEGGARSVEIETASGNIDLSALSGSASVTGVGGNLVLRWDALGPGDTVTIRSLKGDVTLVFPHTLKLSGTVTTTSGKISSGFPGEVNENGDTVTLTGDGPHIEVETASGTITLVADRGWFAPKD